MHSMLQCACHLACRVSSPHSRLLVPVSAIAAVPALYTQVLHLMNKMNLPCPFASQEDLPVPDMTLVSTS